MLVTGCTVLWLPAMAAGGMAERAVVLTFEDPDAFYAGTK